MARDSQEISQVYVILYRKYVPQQSYLWLCKEQKDFPKLLNG